MLTLFNFIRTVGGALIKAGCLTRCRAAIANTSVGWQVASSKRLVGEVAGSRQAAEWRRRLTMGGVVLLRCFGYQSLTDGICDDVLDVVEDIASETVIELMQEEKGIKEIYDSEKKMYT
jgi:hypothetical protein